MKRAYLNSRKMGQRFHLVAPRAKFSLSWGGKLGEILFDGSAQVLVSLLTVPVRPSTPRLINSRLATQLQRGGDGTPSTDLAEDSSANRLAKRKQHQRTASVVDSPPRKRAKPQGDNIAQTDQPVKFSALPVEVHQLIFAHIELVDDVVCLGTTSRYFWAVSQEYIHNFYTGFLGRWAGKNIVCVGEDVEAGDYPPKLFSETEREELWQTSTNKMYTEDYPDGVQFPPVQFTLHHFSYPNVSYIEKDVNFLSESLKLLARCSARGSYVDVAYLIGSALLVEESDYWPQDERWVLRNLTTKEFVRAEAVALKPEYIHGPKIDVLGFGEVVMSRICWSSSSSASMSYKGNITRGVWAGHCFDITTLSRHAQETRGKGWKDVSKEVMEEVAGIWESEYGSDWREQICNRRHQSYRNQ